METECDKIVNSKRFYFPGRYLMPIKEQKNCFIEINFLNKNESNIFTFFTLISQCIYFKIHESVNIRCLEFSM